MRYSLEPTDVGSSVCKCCGDVTHIAWGSLYSEFGEVVGYRVEWTQDKVRRHGAYFDLALGRWDEGATPAHRSIARLELRISPSGPALMVIDAPSCPEIAERSLTRSDVMGTPLARQLYEMVDAVWLHDERIRELTGAPRSD